jgi:hypothetical protein
VLDTWKRVAIYMCHTVCIGAWHMPAKSFGRKPLNTRISPVSRQKLDELCDFRRVSVTYMVENLIDIGYELMLKEKEFGKKPITSVSPTNPLTDTKQADISFAEKVLKEHGCYIWQYNDSWVTENGRFVSRKRMLELGATPAALDALGIMED